MLGMALTVGRMNAGSQLRGSGGGGASPDPGASGRGYWLGSAGCSGGCPGAVGPPGPSASCSNWPAKLCMRIVPHQYIRRCINSGGTCQLQ